MICVPRRRRGRVLGGQRYRQGEKSGEERAEGFHEEAGRVRPSRGLKIEEYPAVRRTHGDKHSVFCETCNRAERVSCARALNNSPCGGPGSARAAADAERLSRNHQIPRSSLLFRPARRRALQVRPSYLEGRPLRRPRSFGFLCREMVLRDRFPARAAADAAASAEPSARLGARSFEPTLPIFSILPLGKAPWGCGGL